MRAGAYPGSFDPPTVAHVAIADAARLRHGLDRVDLVVSISAINKEHVVVPSLEDRVAVLEALARRLGWMGVVVSDRRLIVDLAEGYDLVVMGADKWAQVNDATYYESVAARDEAVARLPPAVVVPRPPHPAPAELLLPLNDAEVAGISSTRARGGERHLMVAEAADLDLRTGAWTDPERYRRRRQ